MPHRNAPSRRSVVLAAAALVLSACATGTQSYTPVFHPPPGGVERPFSEAVRVGPWLVLAGRLGMRPDGTLAPGGVQAETRQAMTNIQETLERHGASMDHVVKCTVFLADIQEWAAMNEVYVTFFREGHRPARSAVGVSGLARDARLEIECLAVVP